MHNPFVPPKGKLVEFWKILEELKDDGTITASLGVSNFRPQVRLSPPPPPAWLFLGAKTSPLTLRAPQFQDLEELLPECKYKPVVNQLGELSGEVFQRGAKILQLKRVSGAQSSTRMS